MNKKNQSLYSKIFVIALIVILLAFIVTTVLFIFKPFDYKKISDLKETSVETCLKEEINAGGKQSDYLVLVYSKDNKDNEFIEEAVTSYANFVRSNKDKKNIYVLEYNESNKDAINNIVSAVDDESSLPYMFIVKNESVSTRYKDASGICNYLEEEMHK